MSQVERLVSDQLKDAEVSHRSYDPLKHQTGQLCCLVAFIWIFLQLLRICLTHLESGIVLTKLETMS